MDLSKAQTIPGLEPPLEGLTRDGSFMYELLSKANITFETIDIVLQVLENAVALLTEMNSSSDELSIFGGHASYLHPFLDLLHKLFSWNQSDNFASYFKVCLALD
jgi:hypothetical protein